MNSSNLSFTITPTPNDFQILNIHISGGGVMAPEEIAHIDLPANLDYTKGVIISGKASVWLYAHLSHKLHIASWVACFDPRFGGLIVQNHSTEHSVGEIIALERLKPYLHPVDERRPERETEHRGKAIAFVGPPHSGKSVLMYAMKLRLQAALPSQEFHRYFFIVRGCPDGEGDWFHEADQEFVKVIRHKGSFTEDFVNFVSSSLQGMRQTKRLIFVDCGGRIDRKNQQIWNLCTHAMIISSNPEAFDEWAGAVKSSELNIVATIQSTLETKSVVLSKDPLHCELGPSERGKSAFVQIPDELLEAVLADTGLKVGRSSL